MQSVFPGSPLSGHLVRAMVSLERPQMRMQGPSPTTLPFGCAAKWRAGGLLIPCIEFRTQNHENRCAIIRKSNDSFTTLALSPFPPCSACGMFTH